MRLPLLAVALALTACSGADAPPENAVVTDLTADPAYGSGGLNGFDAGAANEVAAPNLAAPVDGNSAADAAQDAPVNEAANATE